MKKTGITIFYHCRPHSQFFFYEFLEFLHDFPSPLLSNTVNMGEKIRKNSDVHTCLLTILSENFKIFEPPPSEGKYFLILAIYGLIIRVGVGGLSQKFFWTGFTSRLTFWVGVSSIDERTDFTIFCGETFCLRKIYFKCMIQMTWDDRKIILDNEWWEAEKKNSLILKAHNIRERFAWKIRI